VFPYEDLEVAENQRFQLVDFVDPEQHVYEWAQNLDRGLGFRVQGSVRV